MEPALAIVLGLGRVVSGAGNVERQTFAGRVSANLAIHRRVVAGSASASGAEICCLLSALTDMPIRQDLAMTGAIDQVGHILPVGGVNEKIEGFFDACQDVGPSGTQGVIIPKANEGDLMLREDVVHHCRDGRFQVYAVETVHEALELLTAIPAGVLGADGCYPDGTLLALAVERARDYWRKAARPDGARPTGVHENDAESSEPPVRS